MTQGYTKGVPIDTDPTMALNSNQVVPSQAAVVTYLAAQIAPKISGTATQYNVIVGGSANAIGSVGTGTAGQVLQSGGASANPAYSTPTYPSSSGTSRKILVSDGTNNIYSTETYAVPGTSGNVMTSDGTNWTSAAAPGGGLLSVNWTLTNAQIKALHATPVQILAAPGAGKVIVPVNSFSKLIYGGTNVFTAGASQTVAYAYGTIAANITALSNATIILSSSSYDTEIVLSSRLVGTTTSIQNSALNLYNPQATEITGNAAANNTMAGTLIYYILTI